MNSKTSHRLVSCLFGFCFLVVVPGCPATPVKPDPVPNGKAEAVTTLQARSGSAISGEASFAQDGDSVRIVVSVKGATPGEHGLHIHDKGDCSATDAVSAGPHFNPGGHNHGGLDQSPRHAGDLGNISVGTDGTGKLEVVLKGLTVVPGERSVVGRALVLHEKPDDLRTQPSGNSGARIGCGEIAAKSGN